MALEARFAKIKRQAFWNGINASRNLQSLEGFTKAMKCQSLFMKLYSSMYFCTYRLSQILALCTNVTSELEGSRREVQ